jgi:hypothetical protein
MPDKLSEPFMSIDLHGTKDSRLEALFDLDHSTLVFRVVTKEASGQVSAEDARTLLMIREAHKQRD